MQNSQPRFPVRNTFTRREWAGHCLVAAPAIALGAQRATRPNFLFFFPDQWRPDWTGFTKGMDVRLPVLEKLASRGVRFEQAVVASPVCAPSRACLAAGREYDACGVASNKVDYPVEQRTYYGALRDAGYHVIGCGKLDLHKPTQNWGLDGRYRVRDWGFSDAIDSAGKFDAINSTKQNGRPMDPFMEHLRRQGLLQAHLDDFAKRTGRAGYTNTAPCPLPDPAYGDTWVAENALTLLRATPEGKPWHLVVNFPGPHNPVDITKSMHERAQGRNYPAPIASSELSAEQHNRTRQNYTAMCENIDFQMGRILDEVERRGERERTIIVFCSDHGEMLGDHNRWGKSVPHQAAVGVPMVIAGPGIAAGVSNALVSHIDIAATFLDYAALGALPAMSARSLRPLLEGRTKQHRDVLQSGLDGWRLAWDGRFKLVRGFRYREGEVEGATPDTNHVLFDLLEDPEETRNVAARNPAVVERLSKQLPPAP